MPLLATRKFIKCPSNKEMKKEYNINKDLFKYKAFGEFYLW